MKYASFLPMRTSCFRSNIMIRHPRTLIPALIIFLLWGMWAYAVHHHDHALSGDNGECRMCLYGAHSSAPLPAEAIALVTIPPDQVMQWFSDFLFVSPQTRAQEARAPPYVS
jgi:hypothetical protein